MVHVPSPLLPGTQVQVLDMRVDSGVFAVRSDGPTVYYLDLRDGRVQLCRVPGEGGPTGPFDGAWLPLVRVEGVTKDGRLEYDVVRVGRRHRYTMDPDPEGLGDEIWWTARLVTTIDAVSEQDCPDGRTPELDEYDHPFAQPEPGAKPVT